MKLSFVEVSGFRGIRDKTRIELPPGFAVLTGRNGAGKSTILDAIDFALTGTINKFSVKSAKGGGLDEHIWWVGSGRAEQNYVSVGFTDGNGTHFSIKRSQSHGLETGHQELILQLCSNQDSLPPSAETLMQTTLIRDETIVALSLDLPEQQRFAAVRAAIGGLIGPDYSRRTGAIITAADSARQRQALRSSQAQDELGRALTELTETRSAAERSSDISHALNVLEQMLPSLPSDPRERAEAARSYLADRKRALREIEDAIARSRALTPEITCLSSQKYEHKKKLPSRNINGSSNKRAELTTPFG